MAQRWGLTSGKMLFKQKDLKRLFKKNWNKLHLQIIYYEEYCKAESVMVRLVKFVPCYLKKKPVKTKKA